MMNPIDPQYIAASVGAAIAFLLMRLGEWLTAWHNKVQGNHSGLLRMEVVYRQYLIEVSGLQVRVAAILEKKHPLHAVVIGLPELSEPSMSSADIQSLDLLNILATHWTNARKLNGEIMSAANARRLLESALCQPTPNGLDAKSLFPPYLATLNVLPPFLKELEDNTLEVISALLVLLRTSGPPFTRLFDRWHPRWASRHFAARTQKELVALRLELDAGKRKRRAEMQTLTGENT